MTQVFEQLMQQKEVVGNAHAFSSSEKKHKIRIEHITSQKQMALTSTRIGENLEGRNKEDDDKTSSFLEIKVQHTTRGQVVGHAPDSILRTLRQRNQVCPIKQRNKTTETNHGNIYLVLVSTTLFQSIELKPRVIELKPVACFVCTQLHIATLDYKLFIYCHNSENVSYCLHRCRLAVIINGNAT